MRAIDSFVKAPEKKLKFDRSLCHWGRVDSPPGMTCQDKANWVCPKCYRAFCDSGHGSWGK
jgi:hypothetical protein